MNVRIYFDTGLHTDIKQLNKIIIYPYSGETKEVTDFEKFKLSKHSRYTFIGNSILIVANEHIHHVEFYN